MPEHQQRIRLTALVLAFAALLWPTLARGAVRVSGVDASRYPTMHASVVTSEPSKAKPVIREDGAPVVGLDERTLAEQKSVVLALDRSRSMAGAALADATAAAAAFIAAKPADDRISVVAFASHAVDLTRFATSTMDADNALRAVTVDPREGTALYDAVVMAANQLSAEAQPGRVIIALTDGHDVSSVHTLADAIAAAKRAGAVVYPIGIEGHGFTPAPLEQLAHETGGTYYPASSSSALAHVYSRIADELGRTWRVTYVTAARPGDHVKLTASVAGEGTASDVATVPGQAPRVAAPSSMLPKQAYESPLGTFALMGLIAALVLVAVGFVLASRKAVWVKNRLEPHMGAAKRAKRATVRERFAMAAGLFRATEHAFGNLKQWRAVSRLLERADLPIRTVEFFYICVGAGLALGFAAAVAAQPSLVILLMLTAGAAAPVVFVWFKAKRRLRAFEDHLADLLITMAAALKAGHSFRQGIQSVVEEGQEPASTEFKRVLTDTSLGRPMDDALGDMAVRLGSKNFEFVITAVTIQRQVGGSMAGLFDMVAETVRQRHQFLRKVRGLTAMGRMSAYVLVGLPFFMAAALTFMNHAYMAPLYHSGAGHVLIAVALGMIMFGAAVLKKLVSFKG